MTVKDLKAIVAALDIPDDHEVFLEVEDGNLVAPLAGIYGVNSHGDNCVWNPQAVAMFNCGLIVGPVTRPLRVCLLSAIETEIPEAHSIITSLEEP